MIKDILKSFAVLFLAVIATMLIYKLVCLIIPEKGPNAYIIEEHYTSHSDEIRMYSNYLEVPDTGTYYFMVQDGKVYILIDKRSEQ